MTLEKYLHYREIFLSRYVEHEYLNYCFIDDMLSGIYKKELFFKIFSMDMKYQLFMVVSSLDRHRRFQTWNNKNVGSRIKILGTFSRYDKHPELFEKDKDLIK